MNFNTLLSKLISFKTVSMTSNKELMYFIKDYLSKYSLTIDDIKKKFEIEATWNTLIFQKYKDQVEIDVEKLKKKLNKEK